MGYEKFDRIVDRLIKLWIKDMKTEWPKLLGISAVLGVISISVLLPFMSIRVEDILSIQHWKIGAFALFYLTLIIIANFSSSIAGVISATDRDYNKTSSLALKRSASYLAFLIISFLLIAIGLVLLIIPGIIISVYLAFGAYLVIDGMGPIESIKESFRLVKGRWIATFLILTILGTVEGIFFQIISRIGMIAIAPVAVLYGNEGYATAVLFAYLATAFFIAALHSNIMWHLLEMYRKVK